MYIFYITLLVCVFVLFWQTIYTIVKAYSDKALNASNMYIGNIWFICLLIINKLVFKNLCAHISLHTIRR